jgi:hypothetical protein
LVEKAMWSIKKHLSIIISIFLIISLISFIPNTDVKGDLSGPRSIYGYIKYGSNGSAIPNGKTVYLLDVNTGYNTTTTTIGGGLYIFTVQFGVDGGDIMAINCSLQSAGSWLHGANACNLSTSGPADVVNFSVYAETISISINDTSWYAGELGIGTTNNTNETSDSFFNLSSVGNTKVNIAVHGENITFDGNTWYIKSTPGHNNYTLKYKKNGGTWQTISYSNSTFRNNLYPNNDSTWWFYKISPYTYWQSFGLNITLPTSADNSPTNNSTNYVNVTFWAIKA